LKHRWRLDQNYLAGITAGRWWQLLRANRFDGDAVYWHRAAFITILSVLNSLGARREERVFLLSRGPQFGYPNICEVLHPYLFLLKSPPHTARIRLLLGSSPSPTKTSRRGPCR